MLQGQNDGPSSIHRVPAELIEALVMQAIRNTLANRDQVSPTKFPSDHELIALHLDCVTLRPKSIDITIQDERDPDETTMLLSVPWTKPSPTRRREILEPEIPIKNLRPIRVDEQARLLRTIALARQWVDELIDGLIPDTSALAAREGKTERSIRMSLSLAFLDPALMKAACEGRLPRGYGVSRLADLPPDFDDQWRALGLVRPA